MRGFELRGVSKVHLATYLEALLYLNNSATKLGRKDPIFSYSTKKEIQNLAQHLTSQPFDCNDMIEDGSNSSSSRINEMSLDMCIEKATEKSFKRELQGITYSIRARPLGGFVSFPDDEKNSNIPEDDPNLFRINSKKFTNPTIKGKEKNVNRRSKHDIWNEK